MLSSIVRSLSRKYRKTGLLSVAVFVMPGGVLWSGNQQKVLPHFLSKAVFDLEVSFSYYSASEGGVTDNAQSRNIQINCSNELDGTKEVTNSLNELSRV